MADAAPPRPGRYMHHATHVRDLAAFAARFTQSASSAAAAPAAQCAPAAALVAHMGPSRPGGLAAAPAAAEARPGRRLAGRLPRVHAELYRVSRAYAAGIEAQVRLQMVPAPRRGRHVPLVLETHPCLDFAPLGAAGAGYCMTDQATC